jgi:hypothetical protein
VRLLRLISITFSLVLYEHSALGCNGPPPPPVDKAFRLADVIVVAEVVSIRQSAVGEDTSGRFLVEDAVFKVLEVFKGSYAVGTLLHTHSELGRYGPCGVSALNKPVWLEDAKGQPAQLSGRWLIYGQGAEPYELQSFNRTAPMEAGGQIDVIKLRQMIRGRPGPHAYPDSLSAPRTPIDSRPPARDPDFSSLTRLVHLTVKQVLANALGGARHTRELPVFGSGELGIGGEGCWPSNRLLAGAARGRRSPLPEMPERPEDSRYFNVRRRYRSALVHAASRLTENALWLAGAS